MTYKGAAWAFIAGALLLTPLAAAPAPLQTAQLGDPGPEGPSYGYQPYNDRKPTGFYHPGGMGYGRYYLTQKHHGHRIPALGYRRFRST